MIAATFLLPVLNCLPPQPNANPSTTPCGQPARGAQYRSGIAPDGTIYTVSKGHLVTPLQLSGSGEFNYDRPSGQPHSETAQ